MRKLMLAGLLGLTSLALPAQAQYYGPAVTNPFARPGWAAYGPYGAYPYYGNPAAIRPGAAYLPTGAPVVGLRPGILPGDDGQGSLAGGQRSILDPASPNQTGHPVRFQAYQGYFMNPNATLLGGGAAAPGGVAAGLNPAGTLNTGLSRFGTPGKRPVRGKENLSGTGP